MALRGGNFAPPPPRVHVASTCREINHENDQFSNAPLGESSRAKRFNRAHADCASLERLARETVFFFPRYLYLALLLSILI
jgi:hypothetical protein